MKLQKIQINNFRSIKSERITIDTNCLILLGKNEAGKSNILKAIASVFGQYKLSSKDRRKRVGNEKIIEDNYYIRAIIKLDEDDLDEIIQQFQKECKRIELIVFKNQNSLESLIKKAFHEILLQVRINDNEKPYMMYWNFSDEKFSFATGIFYKENTFSSIADPLFKSLTIELLLSRIFETVKKYYEHNKFTCNLWQYKEEYLLPDSIDIDSFTADPNSIIPLKNIFVMCGRGNIKQEFLNAMKEDGDYTNLLDQVSAAITKKVKETWKDFRKSSIKLISNGDSILIKVSEATKYSFADRSDGFKKFISILLMISTRARAGMIDEKDIILIDEPDQSLYPSSAKYLRDELFRISENALVIYATHSQYMIDPNCIERHLIVEKDNKTDVTSIKKCKEDSPYCEDELLLNAIGTSIFECIKKKNIIFEGWLDKELFVTYCDFEKLKNVFNNVGVVYLGGISGVFSLVQIMILAKKDFIIVSDSDSPSKSKHKEFTEKYKEYSHRWLEYGAIDQKFETMEDFFNEDYITATTTNFGYSHFKYDPTKKAILNIKSALGELGEEILKERIQDIKKTLLKNCSKSNLHSEYGKLIDKIKKMTIAE